MTRRLALFGPAVVTGPVLWALSGELAGIAGLAVLSAVALFAVPVVLLGVLLAPGAVLFAVVPRSWRARYRRVHGRHAAQSAYISERLRRAVLAADRHRCVACGARSSLQVDHYRPWAAGGQTSITNCLTLDSGCNRVKSNYWRDRDGYVHYRPFPGADDRPRAAAILAMERRARRNPLRWWRAAWVMR